MTKIGLMIGTFDPPHIGHLSVANSVIDKGLVDYVWFLPCWQHAFGKNPSPFYHRVAMCYLLVRDIQEMYVCTAEAEIKSTYSIDVLEHLTNNNKDNTFNLILGTDNYREMDRWKNKEKVVQLAPPIWVKRPDVENIPVPSVYNYDNTSSTYIRSLLNEKDRDEITIKDLTTSDVFEYIKKQNLY